MSGELRAVLGAGRLQRILTIRLLRATFAGVAAIAAPLVWMAGAPPAPHVHATGESTAHASSKAPEMGAVLSAARPQANRTARPAAPVVVRHLFLTKARLADGDGDTTLTPALASSPTELFGDVAESARARLHWLAQSHPPYGDPSPFDATAPPSSSPRNG